MLAKLILIVFLLAIVFSLGSSLVYLVKDKGATDRVVKGLTWRIALSLILFITLFILFAFGLINPNLL